MTNHWVDLQNCKTILVEGSNVAENHPMAYKWIRKAQENGAKLIHVDPRYTRTSAGADVYARIRPGTDAAFQNTMINHIIVNKLYDEDYIVTHTNALFLGDEAFDFKDGLFSGYDAEQHKYDTTTWGYQLDAKRKPRVASSLVSCRYRLRNHDVAGYGGVLVQEEDAPSVLRRCRSDADSPRASSRANTG